MLKKHLLTNSPGLPPPAFLFLQTTLSKNRGNTAEGRHPLTPDGSKCATMSQTQRTLCPGLNSGARPVSLQEIDARTQQNRRQCSFARATGSRYRLPNGRSSTVCEEISKTRRTVKSARKTGGYSPFGHIAARLNRHRHR